MLSESTWWKIDSFSHRFEWLPDFIQNWICYRFDKSLGMFDDEI